MMNPEESETIQEVINLARKTGKRVRVPKKFTDDFYLKVSYLVTPELKRIRQRRIVNL